MANSNMVNFEHNRQAVIDRFKKEGRKVTEPDTVWGSGPVCFPRVDGIAGLYLDHSVPKSLGKPANPNYMGTKYADELCERLFAYDFYDNSMGDLNFGGYYARIDLEVADLLELGWIYFADRFSESKDGLPVAAMLSEDDRGFCDYRLFWNKEEFDQMWSDHEQDYIRWCRLYYEDAYGEPYIED